MARKQISSRETPEICPVCGEEVPPKAAACPECGADHNTGWREETGEYDGIDLPEEDFNYDDFLAREFGSGPKPSRLWTGWWIAALLVLLALLALVFRFSAW